MLKGIDISYFQGNVDFQTLKSQIDFVIIRASYGVGYIDEKFAVYREQARSNGIPVGFYHYAYPQYNAPEDEAKWFLQTLGTVFEGDILCLDFEEKWGGNTVDWCKRFLDTLSVNLNGYKPLIYLNKNLIQSYDWSPVVNSGYNLWVAHYDNDPQEVHFNTPWPKVALKQYTDTGRVAGILVNVDMNTFFGEFLDFKNLGYQLNLLPKPVEQSILEAPVKNENTQHDFSKSLTDRKFLLTVFASIMAGVNSKINFLGLTQAQFFMILAPFISWIIAEGLVDIYKRAKV